MTAFDARWQEVTCSRCKRTYQCTPEDDYYGPPGGRAAGPGDGVCFMCGPFLDYHERRLGERGIDGTGAEPDPRTLALKPGDGAA